MHCTLGLFCLISLQPSWWISSISSGARSSREGWTAHTCFKPPKTMPHCASVLGQLVTAKNFSFHQDRVRMNKRGLAGCSAFFTLQVSGHWVCLLLGMTSTWYYMPSTVCCLLGTVVDYCVLFKSSSDHSTRYVFICVIPTGYVYYWAMFIPSSLLGRD